MNCNFKIIITSRNAELFIEKCLLSLKNQKYKNFKAIVIDDCSEDKTWEIINNTVINDDRFILQQNKQRKFGLANKIEGSKILCTNDEDILVILDGDDWFLDNTALEYLNFIYQDENVWITYGQYKVATDDGIGGCKYSETPFVRYINTDRNLSHLRSYKYWLLKRVQDKDLRETDGEYYKFTEDATCLYPMAEMAGNHLKFLPRPTYLYNNLSEFNEYKIYEGESKLVYHKLLKKIPYPQVKKNEEFKKLSVKIYDKEFPTELYACRGDINHSVFIEWYRGNEPRDFVFYTDRCLSMIDNPETGIKVAWLLEPEAINQESYKYIKSNYHKFDYIITHDREILETIPRTVFIPSSQSWIKRGDWKLYDKKNLVSYFYSYNPFVEGHKIRKEILTLSDKINTVVGTDISPVNSKLEILKESYFCIVAQNNRKDYYFTEHLIDCFLTGTVPIFFGCPSVGKFFDIKGMLIFNSIDELNGILDFIKKEGVDWYNRNYYTAIRDNFNTAHQYYLQEDYIYNHFFRKILCGVYPC